MDLTDKTLLITGIGSFIGLRTTEMALAQGMSVRGLEKPAKAAQEAEARGAQVVIGQTTDKAALARACEGVDLVFHTESVIDASGDLEYFRAVNVGGTIQTAEAAKQAGAQAFVHLSSVMVYGFDYAYQVAEDGALKGENNPFCQTKIESETEILKFNDPPQFGVIIIRAGDIYGPGAEVWVMRPLKLMQQKKFVLINGGRGIINHVYIDNLIDSIFLALEKEVYGEAFNITDGCQTTWKEYYLQLAAIGGMPKPISMPAFLVKKAAQLQSKEANISPEAIPFVTRLHPYSIAKAQRVLGYQPRVSFDQGLARTAAWLSTYSDPKFSCE
ncbi:MAG: NAD-dependent epimerase/dehydratase family protein [Acaryochloris sp. RU_4_1]|nr:NAD-dependent epimerase/dehydratase family protein [Acaryochloris sp. RU_4_1]NJR54276.1 NAD-dependent epimerase/dehydratase family protein [Acaryochloris sp. CRU_2_0]